MPPVRPRPQPNTTQPKTGKKQPVNPTTIIIGVIALLVVVIVGSFFLFPSIQKHFRKTPTQVIVEEPPVEEIKVVEEPVEELKPLKQESSSSVPKGFYIVVGSYRIKNNADRMVKNRSKDIELKVLFFDELGLYRVSAGHYDNIHKAYNDMYSIKDLDGCSNAWVLENR